MLKTARLDTLLHIALCLLAFSIPTWFIVSSVCLVLVILIRLLQGNFSQILYNFKDRKALWPWLIFYVLLIISFFYSDDKGQSAFDLKTKLAYLILPIVVGAGVGNISRKHIEQLFLSLIAGVVFTAIISLINATIIWYPEKYFYSFFYHQLVSIVDPNAVYTAWYTIFSISLLLFMPWHHYFKGGYKIIRALVILFLFTFFILLSARMFILLFLLFIIPYFLKKSFSNWKRGILVSIVTICTLYGIYDMINTSNNPLKKRYADLVQSNREIAWQNDYSTIEESQFDNVSLRIFLWRLGMESIVERKAWLTGVGNGDVHLVLNQKMRDYKIQHIDNPDVSKRPGFYNANLHNMFLQVLVMLGIPGLITFILICIWPLFYIRQTVPYQPFLLFHITSILFMMQEAVLQTQAGIFFYIFISSIFLNMYYSQKHEKKKLM